MQNMQDCGPTEKINGFRYRAAAIIEEDLCAICRK